MYVPHQMQSTVYVHHRETMEQRSARRRALRENRSQAQAAEFAHNPPHTFKRLVGRMKSALSPMA